jgi:hypothetical protein
VKYSQRLWRTGQHGTARGRHHGTVDEPPVFLSTTTLAKLSY